MRARVLISFGALVAASAWCVLLLVVRKHEFGAAGYPYLVWNLVLAWMPLALAVLLVITYARSRSAVELLAVGGAWLLFLPNAPYMLTDFIHLGPEHKLFDTVVIGSFALTAVALGFLSLVLVQLVVTRAAGAMLGWATAIFSLFAASFGIYLGRVLRFNSWDVVRRPNRLFELAKLRVDDPFAHRYLIGFTLALGSLLVLMYLGLYGFTLLVSSTRREQQPLVGSDTRWPSR
jgi:uncharacterized membrane protein